MRIRLEFEPKNIWIGIYWTKKFDGFEEFSKFHCWICLIPCFPIHIIKENTRAYRKKFKIKRENKLLDLIKDE